MNQVWKKRNVFNPENRSGNELTIMVSMQEQLSADTFYGKEETKL
jgi:hypothetical protein